MSEKNEALRLADMLERMPLGECDHQAAAELRRQREEIETLKAQRDALLAALKELMEYAGIIEERCDTVATNKARAAIKAVEGAGA